MLMHLKALIIGSAFLLVATSMMFAIDQPEPLIWGVIPDYPPYSFIDEETGEPIGFVIDVVSQALDELGVEYVFNIEAWNTMYDRVLSSEVHAYAPFVRIPEREEIVYWPEHSLASSYTSIATAHADRITSIEDLVNQTFIVVENDFPSATAFEDFMTTMRIPYTLNTVSDFTEALVVLEQGDALGLIVDSMITLLMDFKISPIAFNPRAGYWTSSAEAEPWVIEIVDQVAIRIDELRDNPASYYYVAQDRYFPSVEPAEVEVLPVWTAALIVMLLAAVVVALIIVHLLTVRIRANASALREAVHQKTIELTSVYEQLVQSEKMVTLGEAVAGMAHEVATPLGVAYTAATLLNTAHSLSTDKFLVVAKDTLPVIVENLQRTGNLIRTFKQITIDQSTGAFREITLPDYFQQIWESLSQKYGKRSIQFITYAENHLDEHVRVRLLTYPGALSRVLIHLFDNAVEHGFMPSVRKPIISCVTRIYHEDDDMYIQITVEDNGVGYQPEAQSKIMEPFYTTRVDDASHSGLGLPSVYRTLEKLWNLKSWKIENRERAGVRVQFLLQVKSEEEKNIIILD